MDVSRFAARWSLALACATAATPAPAQVENGRWSCQVGGVDVEIAFAGEQATVAFANGERFTLTFDPTRSRPFYTDGKVGLRVSGGGPMSTRGPEWVRFGEATSVERCVPMR